MTAPEALRDAGMAQAENAADPRVIATIDRLIAWANETREEWSANSIRAALPVTSRGLVGARVRAAAMRKPPEMVRVGMTRSDLPSTHNAWIAVWRGIPQPPTSSP